MEGVTPLELGVEDNDCMEHDEEGLYECTTLFATNHNTNGISTTRHVGRIAIAVFLVLLAVAYAISNLLLEVSLSFSDPDLNTINTFMMNEQNDSDSSQTLLHLKLVTMNIAGMEPSESAPETWHMAQQQGTLLREILRSDPDIIALQEVPSAVLPSGFFDHDDRTYRQLQSVPSHAGYVTLFVRSEMETRALQLEKNVPITATILYWKGRRLVIASVHLAPFEQGSSRRQTQVETLIQGAKAATADPTDVLIFLGDTNMRSFEDQTMEHDLGLVDAWKQAGSPPDAKFSWDTMPHGEGESGWQNLYYGKRTRAYQNRYDRVYIKDLLRAPSSSHVNVPIFEFIANKPVSASRSHFLSDHFGIAMELELKCI
eukprot:scaffold5744_cov159-Amphora_coffeaeformis.AAC.1